MVATSSQAEASLRRAAILLNHLDIDARRRLLAQFSTAEANQLRAAAARLSDVDPIEVRRVVTSFLGKVKISSAPNRVNSPDRASQESRGAGELSNGPRFAEVNGGKAAGLGNAGSQAVAPAPADSQSSHESPSRQRLQFLSQVSDTTLLMVLRDEHPQTIAVVLGALPASQAAHLLKSLAPERRIQALRRLGRLDDIPGEILEEIASHLRKTVGEIEPTLAKEGHRTLVSIFSALDPSEREALLPSLEHSDSVVSRALQVATTLQPATAQPAANTPPLVRSPNNDSITVGTQESAPYGLRVLPESQAAPPRAADIRASDISQRSSDAVNQTHAGSPDALIANQNQSRFNNGDRTSEPFEGDAEATDYPIDSVVVDQLLGMLSPNQLQLALAQLSGHDAMLAVAGLDTKVAKRLYRSLPRRRAKEIQQRVHSLGQMEMRSIEQAKAAVVRVAIASQWVQLPESRSDLGNFAAAPLRRAA